MVVMLGLTLWLAIDKIVLFRDYTKTTGEVIDYVDRPYDTPTKLADKPTVGLKVRYQSADGQTRETISKTGEQPPGQVIGDIVPVWVSKTNPEQARIGTFVELWLWFTVCAVIGGIFFIIWYGTWLGPPPKVS